MFIILLKFSHNQSRAGQLMVGHNEWIQRGFDDGVFLMVGSLKPAVGGAVLANSTSLEELQNRVKNDPFVSENVVTAEIIEITPKQTDERLKFLLR